MFKLTSIVTAILLCATLLLTGCKTTGSVQQAPLDPNQADAVVKAKGMSCPQCSHNISLLMDYTDEIERSRVDLGNGQVYIAFAPGKTMSEAQIADLVDRAGFTPGKVTFLNKGGD